MREKTAFVAGAATGIGKALVEKLDLWKTFPAHLPGDYQRLWKHPGEVLGKTSASFWSAEKFADVRYAQVISAKKMKPRYVLGPSAWILPTISRWVSKSAQETIFEKTFRNS